MRHRQHVGKWGEDAAAAYLESRGYKVAGRNVRTPHGEIDLVVRRENQTVFVEVKTRKTNSMGPPEISVSQRKQAHMIACAEYYAQQSGIDHWQIDVIAVEQVAGRPRIAHFENAVP